MSKLRQLCNELWNGIDPYKEFAQLQRSRQLFVIQSVVLGMCCIFWGIYVAFQIDVFSKTPEPFESNTEKMIPSDPPKALFQFSFLLPVTGTRIEPSPIPQFDTTAYYRPFNAAMTDEIVVPYTISSKFTPFRIPNATLVYECYTFPVYGTVDPNKLPASLLSTILYFQPARYFNSFSFPLLFSVGPHSSTRISNLQVSQFSTKDFLVTQPGSSAQFIAMYEQFNPSDLNSLPEIVIEILLEKTVASNKSIIYSASLFAPPSLAPQSTPPTDFRRIIRVTIKPTVDVVTFSPKNIFTLLGSMAGIFPFFVTSGGFVISLIWFQFRPKKSDEANCELQTIQSQ